MSEIDDCISHVDAIAPFPYQQPTEYGGRGSYIGISRATGGKLLEVDIAVISPGDRLSFSHWHTAREETFYVLKGSPTVVIDGAAHQLRVGSVVTRPAGSGVSHHFVNCGSEDMWILGVNNVPGKDVLDEVYRTEAGLAYNMQTQSERPI